ncbi:MAG: hypothetical protein M1834_009043 [Cirrosporium novae-zelandiae]|nr:MAG: hypothetical protein M1834_009043 [Cirrosporium novae-zelandiae]
MSVALINFENGVPSFIPPEGCQVEIKDTEDDVSFGSHFYGFTQLYQAKQANKAISADIIAITGLGGHAYGSWKWKGQTNRMWLRDFLSKDLLNCRTMICGYDSNLLSYDISMVEDYTRQFLEDIKSVRATKELPNQNEIKLPIHNDHSMIAKFSHRNDTGYKRTLQNLKDFERDAPDIVKNRFSSMEQISSDKALFRSRSPTPPGIKLPVPSQSKSEMQPSVAITNRKLFDSARNDDLEELKLLLRKWNRYESKS